MLSLRRLFFHPSYFYLLEHSYGIAEINVLYSHYESLLIIDSPDAFWPLVVG